MGNCCSEVVSGAHLGHSYSCLNPHSFTFLRVPLCSNQYSKHFIFLLRHTAKGTTLSGHSARGCCCHFVFCSTEFEQTVAATVLSRFRRSMFTLPAPARQHRRIPTIVGVQHPSQLHQRWVAIMAHRTPLARTHQEQGPVPISSPMNCVGAQLYLDRS